MKTIIRLFLLFLAVSFCTSCSSDDPKKAANKLGFKVGFQAYSFRMFTFAEALEKGNSAGLKYVEAYPGQDIGGGIDGTTFYTMDEVTIDKVKALLKEKNIKLKSYGVVSGNNEEEWRQIFDFAKKMGIETITTEPAVEFFDLVEQLCDEYKINVAIHNHPKPSYYWDPDVVLKALEGRSKRMGACADTGHWIRSGLNPLACIKKLEGKIINLHFKDLNEKAPEAHDVPWGTGVSDVPALLKELKGQGFKGIFNAEYEYNWLNSLPEIKQSADNFYEIVAGL